MLSAVGGNFMQAAGVIKLLLELNINRQTKNKRTSFISRQYLSIFIVFASFAHFH